MLDLIPGAFAHNREQSDPLEDGTLLVIASLAATERHPDSAISPLMHGPKRPSPGDLPEDPFSGFTTS